MIERAKQFRDAFEAAECDGRSYVRLREGSPEWMRDVCREAHARGDLLPDDLRYKMIRQASDALVEALEYGDDLDDAGFNFADVIAYNDDLGRWAATPYRWRYVDEVIEEGTMGREAGFAELLAAGMYRERREVWDAVVRELARLADEDEDEDEEVAR